MVSQGLVKLVERDDRLAAREAARFDGIMSQFKKEGVTATSAVDSDQQQPVEELFYRAVGRPNLTYKLKSACPRFCYELS